MSKLFKMFLVFCLLCFGQNVQAELRIDVSGAQSEPLPFAMQDLISDDWATSDLGKEITAVVVADLERSGLFRYISPDAYIQKFTNTNTRPNFADWQAIQAQALIYGTIKEQGTKLNVSFRIWDVFAQTQMEAKSFTAPAESWRKVAHMIADYIYERMTGEKGYFDTRIAFISETGNQLNRVKKLAVMDQDGENVVYLTNGKDLVLTPRFSPNMREVTYFSYQDGKPKVYIMNLATRKSSLVGNFPGMTFAPRFAPDGDNLIMSLANRGNADIYTYNLRTREKKRLTNHPSINTSPSYSPDGKQIVFNSDRGGNQQLYIMNADGSNVHRISFGEGTYATPVWSPRGDYIAFTKIRHGQFHIGVIKPDGSGERLITNGFLVESPTWAPNGRVLMFYRQGRSDKYGRGGMPKLYSIDITGYNEREILTPHDASDPAWSPLLH
ncbi:MAG: Tol-Pal system protein TolB [Alphaproteobacteria bacterium]|nr:Tol-Pal system protein TolB [Alphaproteobacteria bacterium]MBQ6854513.1 Tol-Pal system protein TolB [Alphaproteobacteria bacterium]MBQ8558276.1 Tol-Pal system protein TolB [Alphaproteobacteria bacterium]MBR3913008.1 Tol-Pal system protein TolB [Alphaproteobacteria bacterium]